MDVEDTGVYDSFRCFGFRAWRSGFLLSTVSIGIRCRKDFVVFGGPPSLYTIILDVWQVQVGGYTFDKYHLQGRCRL